ncbi:MAG: hypothetical protein ACRENG_37020 [bacterium]
MLFQPRESKVTIAEAADAFSLVLMHYYGRLRRNGCNKIAALLETAPGQLEM